MGTVPTLRTWAEDEIPTAGEIQTDLFDVLDFIFNPPRIKLRQANAQGLFSGVVHPITWDTVEAMNDEMWVATSPFTITPITPGWYRGWFGASVDNTAPAVGQRSMGIMLNGVTVMQRDNPNPGTAGVPWWFKAFSFTLPFNGTTDSMQVWIFQNSGATSRTTGGAGSSFPGSPWQQPELSMRWFSRL